MGAPRKGDRVLGPYREQHLGGVRFRVILVIHREDQPQPIKEPHFFPDGGAARAEGEITAAEKAAVRYKAKAESAIAGVQRLTITEALEAFLVEIAPNLKSRSVCTQRNLLVSFFEPDLQEPVSSLLRPAQQVEPDKTPELSRAAELYRLLRARRVKPRGGPPLPRGGRRLKPHVPAAAKEGKVISVAHHRHCLHAARRACAFFVERRWLPSNPLQGVKVVGKVNKGKAQLRLDEARRLYQLALWTCEHGTPAQQEGAAAVLTVQILGLRQSELTLRVVRDLDHGGQWLVIDEGKTENSKGTVEIPEEVRPFLLRQAQGKEPQDLLFPGETGGIHHDSWVLNWTKKLCKQAGVPVVCAHALRGGAATIGVTAGLLPHVVAQALRNTEKVSREAYIQGPAVGQGQRERMGDLLRGDRDQGDQDLRAHLAALAERWEERGWGEQAEQLRQVLAGESFPGRSLAPIRPAEARKITWDSDAANSSGACSP